MRRRAMPRGVGRVVGSTVLLALAAAGPARAADGSCDFSGWSKDRDPAGLTVRAAPGVGAAAVARLPAPRRDGEETLAVEVHVVDGRDGWLAIDRAGFADYGAAPATTVFSGKGWVSGRMIDVSVQDERVRERPADTAAIVDAPRTPPTGDPEMLRLERIVACRGRWIEIEGSFAPSATGAGRRTRGWVTGLCGNQVTTCP